MSNGNIDVIDVPNESLLLNLIPLFVRLNTEDKLYRISNSKLPHFLSSPRSSFSCSTSIVKFSLQGTYVCTHHHLLPIVDPISYILFMLKSVELDSLLNTEREREKRGGGWVGRGGEEEGEGESMRDGVGLGKIYYLLNSVGIDLAVNIALLWPSWLAVGDATAHAEQAESSATTTTITITITISTTNISGCKQTYVVEIEKFDFFRRPAAFGTRTPFVWLSGKLILPPLIIIIIIVAVAVYRNGSACEIGFFGIQGTDKWSEVVSGYAGVVCNDRGSSLLSSSSTRQLTGTLIVRCRLRCCLRQRGKGGFLQSDLYVAQDGLIRLELLQLYKYAHRMLNSVVVDINFTAGGIFSFAFRQIEININ
ncbi:hypothetical protein T01_6298 [Trichinella spiralis]|uniref:Uncharacterized protein n=1 Tax=Trichinella spiralis TaxID=6334 RepID=A0A0V1B438_TRISP|nr:hypothetical protein T01_6298 [Trichinella spiralis]